jgi:hypothetical protein
MNSVGRMDRILYILSNLRLGLTLQPDALASAAL